MEFDMTNKFPNNHFTHQVRLDVPGITGWTNNAASAAHFERKQELVNTMMALRELERTATKGGASTSALKVLKVQMIEINRKIIASNRKSDREGWYIVRESVAA